MTELVTPLRAPCGDSRIPCACFDATCTPLPAARHPHPLLIRNAQERSLRQCRALLPDVFSASFWGRQHRCVLSENGHSDTVLRASRVYTLPRRRAGARGARSGLQGTPAVSKQRNSQAGTAAPPLDAARHTLMSLATASISVRQLTSARTACTVSVRPLSVRAAPALRSLRPSGRTGVRTVAMSAVPSNLRVGFAGAGMMAEALARGFAAANVASFANMVATDLSEARRDVFRSAGITIVDSSKEVSAGPDRLVAERDSGCRELPQPQRWRIRDALRMASADYRSHADLRCHSRPGKVPFLLPGAHLPPSSVPSSFPSAPHSSSTSATSSSSA